jgi:hypothetical protein
VAYYALGNLILLATALIAGATAVAFLIMRVRRRTARKREQHHW